jgi:hypothetical protein
MPNFAPVVDNLRGVLAGSAAGLAEAGLFSTEEMRKALVALDEWRADPTASVWYSLPFAEGRRP